jgi:sorting nexin-1/2
MENPIESISFSEREQKYYSIEFEKLTTSQTLPLQDRKLNPSQTSAFLKQLKISEDSCKKIWELVSEGRNFLKFAHFMAAMRLCSALKQGKGLSQETFRSEQQVLARKSRNVPARQRSEEEKRNDEGVRPADPREEKDEEKNQDLNENHRKEFTGISLQVSQEISVSKKFEEGRISSSDEKNEEVSEDSDQKNWNRFGPLQQVVEKYEKELGRETSEIKIEEKFEKVGIGKNGNEIKEFGETFETRVQPAPFHDIEIDPQVKPDFESDQIKSLSINFNENQEKPKTFPLPFSSPPEKSLPYNPPSEEKPFLKPDPFFQIHPKFDTEINLKLESEKPPFQLTGVEKVKEKLSSLEDIDLCDDFPGKQKNPFTSSSHPPPWSINPEIPQKLKDPSKKSPEEPRRQEKCLNFPCELKHSSPTRLESKVEELKHSPKLVPRVPSLPKIYKGQLKQIPEEVTPPKSSSSRETTITVDSPVLITSGWWGASSYYIYSITTRVSGKVFNVKRRFSDLDWMHNQLLTKYKGFIIPSRPEKKMLGNNEEKFVEERRMSMEKYLNIIAKHPILCNSFAFKAFTQTPNEKFEREKLNAEGVEEYSEYKNIEDAMDQVCALFQNKLQLILSQKVLPFSEEVSAIEEKIVKLEIPVQTFNGALMHWVKTSAESGKVLQMMSISKHFSEKMQGFRSIFRENSGNLKKLALEVKEEQLRLEGLKEALNTYKGTVEECSKLQNLITRKLAKHKSSSNEDTKARYLSEIQATQDVIDKYNKDLEDIENNLIKESKTFEQSKTEHLESTLIDLVELQKRHYEKESNFWSECLAEWN